MTQFKAKKTSILAASLIVAAFASNILIHENAAAATPTCIYNPSDPDYNNAEMRRCIALGEYKILDGDARQKWKDFYNDVNNNGGTARNTQIAGATSIANLMACNENTEYIYRVGQLIVWKGQSLENGIMGDDHNNPTFGLRGTDSDNINWLNDNPLASKNALGKVDSQFYKGQTLYFKHRTSASLVPIAQLTKLIDPTSSEANTLLAFGPTRQPSKPTLFCATSIKRQVWLSDDVEVSFTKPPANTVEPLSVGFNNAGQRVYEIEENSVRVNISIAPLDYVESATYEYSKEIVDLLSSIATVKVGGVTRNGTWKYEDGLAKFQTTIQLTGEGDTAIEVYYPRNIIANGSTYSYGFSNYVDKTIVITLLGTNSCSKWAFDNPDISNTGSFNAAASATANSFGNTHSIRSNSTEPNNTLYVSPKDKSYYRLFYCLGQFASNDVSITNRDSIFFRSNINPYPFEDNLTTPLNLAKGKGQSVLNPKKDTAALRYNTTYTQAVKPNGGSWYRANIVMPYNYVILPTVSISTGSGKAMAGGKVNISANVKAFSRINNAVNDHYAYKTDTKSALVDVRYFETTSLPGASISNPSYVGRSATSAYKSIGGDINGATSVDANNVPISSDSVGKYFCAIAVVSNADSHGNVPAFLESASIPSEVGKNSKLKLSTFGSAWTVDGNSVGTGATITSAPACVKIYGSSKIAVENSSLFVSGAIKTAATNDDNLKSKVSNTIVANGTFAETSNLPSMLAGGSVLGGNTHTVDQQILLNSRCLTNNAYCKTGSAQGKADEIARTVNALKARYTAHSTPITVLNQNFIDSISCVQNASGVWVPSTTVNTYRNQFECSNDGVILINAQSGLIIQAATGRNITVNKDIIVTTNGSVKISSNIELQNASAANAAKIVNFAIVAGDAITVHRDVTYVDAWLIANSLDTCETAPTSASVCNSPVTFKGPVSAGSINLYRTTVTSAGNAEVFSPDADDYYWAYEKSSISDVLKATYVKEYSPRY